MEIKTVGKVRFVKKLKDMGVGESAWTVPWAASFHEDGTVFRLNLSHHAIPEKMGTASMLVTKTGPDKYEVDVRHVPAQSKPEGRALPWPK